MEIKSCSKGEIAILKVQLKAAEQNIIVSKPTTEVRYDLILDIGKEKLRTQVKYLNSYTNKHRPNQLQLSFLQTGKSTTKPYTKDEIDLMLIYCPIIDEILAMYPKHFHDKKRIKVNIKNPKSKYYYKKFIW